MNAGYQPKYIIHFLSMYLEKKHVFGKEACIWKRSTLKKLKFKFQFIRPTRRSVMAQRQQSHFRSLHNPHRDFPRLGFQQTVREDLPEVQYFEAAMRNGRPSCR
jgi:hypothetical protein